MTVHGFIGLTPFECARTPHLGCIELDLSVQNIGVSAQLLMEHRVHPLLLRTPVSLYERICCCTIKISVISARAATVNFLFLVIG